MVELWKDIHDFPFYQVSSAGRIRSLPHATTSGRILKQTITKNGYKSVIIRRKGRKHNQYVHRIVAMAFLGPSADCQINHRDGDRSNNNFENLEWCSASENMHHRSHVLGNGQKPHDQDLYDQIFKLKESGMTDIQIAKKLNKKYSCIYWITHRSMRAKALKKLEGE